MLSRKGWWGDKLAHFEAESAWNTGDWETVAQLGSHVPPLGRVLLGLQRGEQLAPLLIDARREIGKSLTSRHYGRVHQTVLTLHQLHEVEIIHQCAKAIASEADPINRVTINKARASDLIKRLDERFNTTSPSFRIREAVLTIRRTAFGLVHAPQLKGEVGHAWIQSSRIARKAGYDQTAYTAALQARECDAPFAFVQQVKLLKAHDVYKALGTLVNSISLHQDSRPEGGEEEVDFGRDRQLAKVRTFRVSRQSHNS